MEIDGNRHVSELMFGMPPCLIESGGGESEQVDGIEGDI